MKAAVLVMLVSGFAASAAYADPVCSTLDDCLALQAKVAARIKELSPTPVTRTTVSGHTFTQVTNQPALKNAWKDESGVIWGDQITKDAMTKDDVSNYCTDGGNSGPCYMTQQKAAAYCNAIGAHLPTKNQFAQLAKYLGGGSDSGYNPEILPNLIGNWFWSASVLPNYTVYAYDFNGSGGYIGGGNRSNYDSVRCVAR